MTLLNKKYKACWSNSWQKSNEILSDCKVFVCGNKFINSHVLCLHTIYANYCFEHLGLDQDLNGFRKKQDVWNVVKLDNGGDFELIREDQDEISGRSVDNVAFE